MTLDLQNSICLPDYILMPRVVMADWLLCINRDKRVTIEYEQGRKANRDNGIWEY